MIAYKVRKELTEEKNNNKKTLSVNGVLNICHFNTKGSLYRLRECQGILLLTSVQGKVVLHYVIQSQGSVLIYSSV